MGMADMTRKHQERSYRRLVQGYMDPMRVAVQETDLSVYAESITPSMVKDAIIEQRGLIEGYIRCHPEFGAALQPLPPDPVAPAIIRKMLQAGEAANVGPMAAVAGAVAEFVGNAILGRTDEVIVENGGDVFLSIRRDVTIGIYAGRSPLSLKVGLRLQHGKAPLAVCTSSGTVGHSLSYGKADAVCVLSGSCALADAAATSIGNRVQSIEDVDSAVEWGRSIPQVSGILIIIGDKMGMWGEIELAPL